MRLTARDYLVIKSLLRFMNSNSAISVWLEKGNVHRNFQAVVVVRKWTLSHTYRVDTYQIATPESYENGIGVIILH